MARDHAVVIGASMAGLATAAELSRHFGAVTVIERDELPDGAEPRKSVPQSAHAHALLESGEREWNRWYPGFTEALVAAGAERVDGSKARLFVQGDFLSREDRPVRMMSSMTRPLLESVARRFVSGTPNVTVRTRTRATGVLTAGASVRGVTIEPEGGSTEHIEAELVVDCAGRGSAALKWMEEIGTPAPPISKIHAGITYATRLIERHADDIDGTVLGALAAPPDLVGAGMFPVEQDRWIFAYLCINGEPPPQDDESYRAYADRLPIPDAARVLDRCLPCSPIMIHRFPFSQRRHFERVEGTPARLLVVGDAACSFNPIYGQGMSVAAMSAAALGDALTKGDVGDPNFATAFYRRVAKLLDVPWQIGAGGDFQWEGTTGDRPRGGDLLTRYVARLTRAGHRRGAVADTFFCVQQLTAPPTDLVKPGMIWNALRHGGAR